MLALKQALSLVSSNKTGGSAAPWTPSDEASLELWLKNKANIGFDGSNPGVYTWTGEEGTHLFIATIPSEQPSYNASTGALTFDPAATQHMSGTTVSLSGDFTIGILCNINNVGGIILGDNSLDGEFFKIFSTTKLRIRIDNTTAVDVQLDSGVWGDGYIVVTRSSDVLKLWWNGVEQTTATPTLSGTADIDSLGIRKPNLNPYDGSISEVQVFTSTSATLTANVNTRLASL